MGCLIFHKWDGCKCSNCGKIRDKHHKWENSKCIICGIGMPGTEISDTTLKIPCTAAPTEGTNHPQPVGNSDRLVMMRDDSALMPWQLEEEITRFLNNYKRRALENYEINTLEDEHDPPKELPRRIIGTAEAYISNSTRIAYIHIFIRNVMCIIDSGLTIKDVQGVVFLQFVLDLDEGYLEISRLNREHSIFKLQDKFYEHLKEALASEGSIKRLDFTRPNLIDNNLK